MKWLYILSLLSALFSAITLGLAKNWVGMAWAIYAGIWVFDSWAGYVLIKEKEERINNLLKRQNMLEELNALRDNADEKLVKLMVAEMNVGATLERLQLIDTMNVCITLQEINDYLRGQDDTGHEVC